MSDYWIDASGKRRKKTASYRDYEKVSKANYRVGKKRVVRRKVKRRTSGFFGFRL